jgi:riboflavin kinase, archaea type
MEVAGTLVTGRKEGAYYVKLYQHQLQAVLGFTSYLGTLNIRISHRYAPNQRSLVKVSAPKKGLFPVWVQKITVSGLEGAFLFPEKTHHGKDILEVVSPHYLRDALLLRDGDSVTCEVA